MSSKIAVKSPAGLPPSKPAAPQPWNSGSSPRLAKAKSSPNVAKATGLSASRQTIKIDDGAPSTAQKRQTTAARASTGSSKPQQSKSARGNVTIVQISSETENHHPKTTPRATPPRARTSDATGKSGKSSSTARQQPEAGSAKKKPAKEGSPSCTILEDRVLLKKGLSSPPSDKSRLPKKPEELRKKSLNRSTSLWSVQTPSSNGSSSSRSTKSADSRPQKKKLQLQQQQPMNRATSLWSVPADPQCRLGRMPSRIPLSTQHLAGLGQSLGDLSLVDRSSGEKQPQPQPASVAKQRVIGFDEVDRSVDEHIYENCREAIVKPTAGDDGDEDVGESPIYENLNKSVELTPPDAKREEEAKEEEEEEEEAKKPELSVPLTTSELEKRAEQLLSQLDEDDNSSATTTLPRQPQTGKKRIDLNACRLNIERSKDLLSRSRENLNRSREELARSKENLSKTQETLEKSRVLAKSQDSLQILQSGKRTECEINIQEIRRNWERQIEKCQVVNSEDVKASSKKRLTKSSTSINGGSRSDLTLPLDNNSNNKAKLSQVGSSSSKRTKEIEQLVNFFNCKNTESSPRKPASSSPIVIQDAWSSKQSLTAKDAPDVTSSVIKTPTSEKGCGYASDGNSSEDSGHISNENEPDEQHDELGKDGGGGKHLDKTELFLEEIIQDLDSSLERTIEVFDATPLVRRVKEPAAPAQVYMFMRASGERGRGL